MWHCCHLKALVQSCKSAFTRTLLALLETKRKRKSISAGCTFIFQSDPSYTDRPLVEGADMAIWSIKPTHLGSPGRLIKDEIPPRFAGVCLVLNGYQACREPGSGQGAVFLLTYSFSNFLFPSRSFLPSLRSCLWNPNLRRCGFFLMQHPRKSVESVNQSPSLQRLIDTGWVSTS